MVSGSRLVGPSRTPVMPAIASWRPRREISSGVKPVNISGGPGLTVTSGGALSQPLGLSLAPDGDILTVNGGNGKIIETTPAGRQIGTTFLDTAGSPAGAGALFGLTLTPSGAVYYTDDAENTLRLLH